MSVQRVAFIAAEVSPFAKTGGLADVAGALPYHLAAAGLDVRLFMPLHSIADLHTVQLEPVPTVRDVPLHLGEHRFEFSLLQGRLPGSAIPIYFVHCDEAFHRPTLYTTADDEHLRFIVLQRAMLDSCQRLQFAPDIVHCHDWHTALVPLLLKTAYAWDQLFARTRTVLTIHNIGYQGSFPLATAGDLGTDATALLSPESSARGELNWLREGIHLADRVTTVSPTYAWEITTPEGGHGLDGALRTRPDGVLGILNGVDYEQWNPQTDRFLQHHFSASDLSGKFATKRGLLRQINVDLDEDTPLIGIVSRLTVQKGFDLLFDALPQILTTRRLALLVLGSGEPHYERLFSQLHQRFAERVAFHKGYSDELAHRIEAGSDMFLMPSMYEPCGLNQMYSLKYGTVPIVRRTGGLADTVQLWNPETRTGTGIVFDHYDAQGVSWAIHTALDLYKDQESWRQIMLNGMAQDFSWHKQAGAYLEMYQAVATQGSK
jgi:starch synthase